MRKRQVCVYGGTDLPPQAPDFVARLARALLEAEPSMIVTGGFLHFRDSPGAVSTDHAALNGATEYSRAAGSSLAECFSAWLPEPDLDRRHEHGGVVRMGRDLGITLRWMNQRSPLGRRLAMVRDVDVVVTVGGHRHTNEVLEQALEQNRPALPLAFYGGDSGQFWGEYQNRVAEWFSLEHEHIEYLSNLKADWVKDHIPETAAKVAVLAGRARVGRCLVLQPYDGIHDMLFRKVVQPAVESLMICDRLDLRPGSEAIRANFVAAIDRAWAVIADVTDANPNVMYEIGYTLGKGVEPLLYTLDSSSVGRLPVYLNDLSIGLIQSEEDLANRIRAHLGAVRSSRPNLAAPNRFPSA